MCSEKRIPYASGVVADSANKYMRNETAVMQNSFLFDM